MKVDVLFLAHNRREYTEESLRQLCSNTNWADGHRLHIVLDNDTENDDLLDSVITLLPWCTGVTRVNFGSPVAVMNAALSDHDKGLSLGPAYIQSPWFAKIDNDTIVPPGWLDACVAIADTDAVDLIGIEARYCDHAPMQPSPTNDPYPVIQWRSTDHVGGIGLFRRSVFDKYPLTGLSEEQRERYRANGQDPRYYGFTEWQWAHMDVKKAWIDPPLPVFLLDHLPMEPWMSLGRSYVREGWQRESWGYYDQVTDRGLWAWWLNRQQPSNLTKTDESTTN